MHTTHYEDIRVLLETLKPTSVVLIDRRVDALRHYPLLAQWAERVQHLSDLTGLWEQVACLERYDLGIVANALEHLPKEEAVKVIARLRDVVTNRFVALLPMGEEWAEHQSQWQATDLLGLGLSVMGRYESDGKPLHLYHYAIKTYKTTPDWFNNRHWANPEHWRLR